MSVAPRPVQKTVKDYIRSIVDFPHEGIVFRDVTTLFADARGFRMAVDQLLAPYAGMRIDKVVGLEARGFILGGAVAHQLSTGFVPIRKKGKLPGAVMSQAYVLEYGEAVMEIHDDALSPSERVLIVDDLLATGGTAEASISLCKRLGAEVVGTAFVVDLPELGGRRLLEAAGVDVHVLCEFEGACPSGSAPRACGPHPRLGRGKDAVVGPVEGVAVDHVEDRDGQVEQERLPQRHAQHPRDEGQKQDQKPGLEQDGVERADRVRLQRAAAQPQHRAVEHPVIGIVPQRRHDRRHDPDHAKRVNVEAGQQDAPADHEDQAEDLEQDGVADPVGRGAHGNVRHGGPSRSLHP